MGQLVILDRTKDLLRAGNTTLDGQEFSASAPRLVSGAQLKDRFCSGSQRGRKGCLKSVRGEVFERTSTVHLGGQFVYERVASSTQLGSRVPYKAVQMLYLIGNPTLFSFPVVDTTTTSVRATVLFFPQRDIVVQTQAYVLEEQGVLVPKNETLI